MSANSFYKVAAVYLTDLLDFLKNKVENYGSLQKYFEEVNSNRSTVMKSELMMKVSSTIVSVNNLRTKSKEYWRDTDKRLKKLRGIIIFMMVVLWIVIFVLFYFDVKSMKKNPNLVGKQLGFKVIQSIIVYGLIGLIVFTVMLLLLKNLSWKRKQAKAMTSSIDSQYDDLMGAVKFFVDNNSVPMLLELYFHAKRGSTNTSVLKQYKNQVQRVPDSKCLRIPTSTSVDITDLDCIFVTVGGGKIMITDEAALWDKIGSLITSAINIFYTDGYANLRKAVVSGSTVLMLQEMKSKMVFYYKLVQKAKGEDNTEDESDEKNKNIIKSIVIKKLLESNIIIRPSNGGDIPTSQLVTSRLKLEESMGEKIDVVVDVLQYLHYFFYPMWLRKYSSDPEFTLANYSNGMPDRLMPLPDNVPENDASIFRDRVNMYLRLYQDRYKTYMESAKQSSADDVAATISVLDNMIQNELIGYFEATFVSFSKSVPDNYIIVFDVDYIRKKLEDSINPKFPPGIVAPTIADPSYKSLFIDYICQKMIPGLWTSFTKNIKTQMQDRQQELSNKVISAASTELVPTSIKSVMRYKSYIFDEITKDDTPISKDPAALAVYSGILLRIDKQLAQKRAVEGVEVGKKPQGHNYMDIKEFEEKVNKISFQDLSDGLDTEYMSFIVNQYYLKISTGSQDGGVLNTTFDIYYQDRKNKDLLKTLINCIIAILVIGWVYYFTIWIEDYDEFAKKHKENLANISKIIGATKNEEAYLESKRRTQEVFMMVVKIVITPVVLIFLIMLIISHYKKFVVKTDFNKDTIESNTAEFKSALNDLNTKLITLNNGIKAMASYKPVSADSLIVNLTSISPGDKEDILKTIITIIERYEKCNYITVLSQTELPFPYTEVTMDLFMFAITILTFVYLYAKFSPLERIKKIKDLNRQKERASFGYIDKEFEAELRESYACHAADIDSIMFAIKIIGFIFVVMFLLFYTSLIMSSSNEFKNGLYNSKYFEEGKCYDKDI